MKTVTNWRLQIKLVGLKNGGRLSPINLVTFAGTQNGELSFLVQKIRFWVRVQNRVQVRLHLCFLGGENWIKFSNKTALPEKLAMDKI
jgi:hypothetical protein